MTNWLKSTKKFMKESLRMIKVCWKQKYNPKNLKALDYQPVKLETKSLCDENRSDIKQTKQLKQLDLNEISKPLWIKLTRKKIDLLIRCCQ